MSSTQENVKFKPAKQGLQGVEFINAKELNEKGLRGEVLIGTLDGVINNQFGTTDYAFTRSSDNTKVIVNGCGSLRSQLDGVAAGTLCRISYSGVNKIKKGPMKGKSAHQYLVEIESDESAN